MHEPKALLRALTSGKLVYVSDVKQKTTYVSKHVVRLAREYGFNIFAVYSTRYLIGWILLEESAANWWADYLLVTLFINQVSTLGDICQALDYKKCQAAVAKRMPGASAGELADAAFAEYKRVYLDIERAEASKKLKENRFPMSVPDVILDAAFREFKRVERDGQ